MKSVAELCRELGIPPPPSPGMTRYLASCPNCSHQRKPQNRRKPVLGVNITTDGINYGCNHCSHKGGGFFNEDERKTNGRGSNGQFEAVYKYEDEHGKPLFEVCRPPDKKRGFPQRAPDGTWKTSHIRKVPYKLPELIEAVANERLIAIPEGEKDVDNLRRIGIAATCNPGGAKKWQDEFSEHFRGADVVLMNDNDLPGREHVVQVAASLRGTAKRIRVLDLAQHWPECPKGGDVSDWLVAGHTREEIDALIDQAPDAQPAFENTNGDATSDDADELEVVCAADVEMKPIEWFWPKRFALGKVGLIGGMPEEGKSTVAIYVIAQSTQRGGGRWPCGEGRAKHGSAIILTAEDDYADTVVPQLAAAGADLNKVKIIKAAKVNGKRRLFNLMEDIERLERALVKIGDVVLVVIDPLSAYLGVRKMDSYRTSDVRGALAPLQDIASKHHVAVLAIMHLNKNVSLANAIARFSDSLAFIATARHAYICITDPEDQTRERRLFLRAKNNRDKRSGISGKGLAYTVELKDFGDGIEGTYIVWEPEHVDMTADQALAAHADHQRDKHNTGKSEAAEFLREYLADGPMSAKSVFNAAAEAGLTVKNCRDATKALGIKPRKQKGDTKGPWMWELPNAKQREHEHD